MSKASVTVNSNGEEFTAESDSTWLKTGTSSSASSASSRTSYTGNKSVYIFADKNTENASRTGTITLTHKNGTLKKSITVKQDAAAAVLTVSASELTANAGGTLSKSSVTVNSNNAGFTAKSDSSWLKIGTSSSVSEAQAQVSFTGDNTLYVFAEQNTNTTARTGKITLTHKNGTLQKTVTVKQDALSPILIVDTTKKTVNRLGEFYENEVQVKTQKTGGFIVEAAECDWLWIASTDTQDITEGISRLTFESDQSFYLVAAENTGSQRSATVTITHALGGVSKTITVTQKGTEGAYLQTDRESAYFDEPSAAVSGAIQISANEDVRWTVNTTANWIKLMESDSIYASKNVTLEGKGNASFYIYVDENGTFEQRNGYVTLSAPGLETLEIYVSQAENERDLKSLLEETSVIVSRSTFNKGKTSKIKFVFPDSLYPSDVANVKYSSNKKKVATVNKNGIITAKRKGKAGIRVKITLDNGASKTFHLKVTVGKRKVKVTKK